MNENDENDDSGTLVDLYAETPEQKILKELEELDTYKDENYI